QAAAGAAVPEEGRRGLGRPEARAPASDGGQGPNGYCLDRPHPRRVDDRPTHPTLAAREPRVKDSLHSDGASQSKSVSFGSPADRTSNALNTGVDTSGGEAPTTQE